MSTLRNWIAWATRFSLTIPISLLLWAILQYGLLLAGLAYRSYEVQLALALIALVIISSYAFIILLRLFASMNSARSPSSTSTNPYENPNFLRYGDHQ